MLERFFKVKSFGLHISNLKHVPGNTIFDVSKMIVWCLSITVSWLCIVAMYHGYVSWLRIMAMYHGYVSWLCIMAMFHGYVSWLCIMTMYHGYASWLCIMAMYHGYVFWVCITAMYFEPECRLAGLFLICRCP